MFKVNNIIFTKQDCRDVKSMLKVLPSNFRREAVKKVSTQEFYRKLIQLSSEMKFPCHQILKYIANRLWPTCHCSKKELIKQWDFENERPRSCNWHLKCPHNALKILQARTNTHIKKLEEEISSDSK